MITAQQVAALTVGTTLHHATQRNADGTPLRARVNGKVQLWKTRPTDFRIPIKSGLYAYGNITPSVAHAWHLSAADALAANGGF